MTSSWIKTIPPPFALACLLSYSPDIGLAPIYLQFYALVSVHEYQSDTRCTLPFNTLESFFTDSGIALPREMNSHDFTHPSLESKETQGSVTTRCRHA